MPNPSWSVILAAGAGRRLAGLTGGIPKQFWAPQGQPTLLENTVARVQPITPLSRTVTVIDQSHREFANRIARVRPIGHIRTQPMDRGTAAGVLLGLTAIGPDPNAVVLLTPSDHGVGEAAIFQRGVRSASRAVKAGRANVVLFAVRPTSPTGDFGWIVPASSAAAGALPMIATFVEKPASDVAERLYRAGGAWNTMVMVARAGALLDLYREHLPALTDVFRRATALPEERRADFLTDRYPELAHADFSRDLITPARGLQLHIWPTSLGWTDLGTPERLRAWLAAQRTPPRMTRSAHGVRHAASAVA